MSSPATRTPALVRDRTLPTSPRPRVRTSTATRLESPVTSWGTGGRSAVSRHGSRPHESDSSSESELRTVDDHSHPRAQHHPGIVLVVDEPTMDVSHRPRRLGATFSPTLGMFTETLVDSPIDGTAFAFTKPGRTSSNLRAAPSLRAASRSEDSEALFAEFFPGNDGTTLVATSPLLQRGVFFGNQALTDLDHSATAVASPPQSTFSELAPARTKSKTAHSRVVSEGRLVPLAEAPTSLKTGKSAKAVAGPVEESLLVKGTFAAPSVDSHSSASGSSLQRHPTGSTRRKETAFERARDVQLVQVGPALRTGNSAKAMIEKPPVRMPSDETATSSQPCLLQRGVFERANSDEYSVTTAGDDTSIISPSPVPTSAFGKSALRHPPGRAQRAFPSARGVQVVQVNSNEGSASEFGEVSAVASSSSSSSGSSKKEENVTIQALWSNKGGVMHIPVVPSSDPPSEARSSMQSKVARSTVGASSPRTREPPRGRPDRQQRRRSASISSAAPREIVAVYAEWHDPGFVAVTQPRMLRTDSVVTELGGSDREDISVASGPSADFSPQNQRWEPMQYTDDGPVIPERPERPESLFPFPVPIAFPHLDRHELQRDSQDYDPNEPLQEPSLLDLYGPDTATFSPNDRDAQFAVFARPYSRYIPDPSPTAEPPHLPTHPKMMPTHSAAPSSLRVFVESGPTPTRPYVPSKPTLADVPPTPPAHPSLLRLIRPSATREEENAWVSLKRASALRALEGFKVWRPGRQATRQGAEGHPETGLGLQVDGVKAEAGPMSAPAEPRGSAKFFKMFGHSRPAPTPVVEEEPIQQSPGTAERVIETPMPTRSKGMAWKPGPRKRRLSTPTFNSGPAI